MAAQTKKKDVVVSINAGAKKHTDGSTNETGEQKKKLYVLDTNVLIHDPGCLFNFQNNDLFIPLDVLEELDNNKTGKGDSAICARTAIRNLNKIMNDSSRDAPKLFGMTGYPISDSAHHQLGTLYIQNGETGRSQKVFKSFTKDKADNRILAAFEDLCGRNKNGDKKFTDVILVSKDIMVVAKARALNLLSEDYGNDAVVTDSDLLFSGETQLPDHWWAGAQTSQQGNRASKLSIPEDTILYPNQLIHDGRKDGPNLIVKAIEKDAGTFTAIRIENFRKKQNAILGINARNRGQNFALNLLLDPNVPIVTLLGPAGTGKTLLVLISALIQQKDKPLINFRQTSIKQGYDNILMTRATVPMGDDIGFLPGTEEEKMNPWMGAVDDNIDYISECLSNATLENGQSFQLARKRDTEDIDTDRKHGIMRYLRGKVRAKSISMMRGRTFNDRFVIIDEAQNLTPHQVKALVSRVGAGSKIVLMGNLSQIDTPYLTANSSGLTYLAERFKGVGCYGHIILNRIERSRVAELAEKLL